MSECNDSVCASCGKGGDGLKKCSGCKKIAYCNRTCQTDHRPKHKAACKKRAAELFDEQLFKQPLPAEDCPICMLRLPDSELTEYMPCCGQTVCLSCACVLADKESASNKRSGCPFCRKQIPHHRNEVVKRLNGRMKLKDAEAFHTLAAFHRQGFLGEGQQHINKSNDLLLQGAELGSMNAHSDLGFHYLHGKGLEKNRKKAIHHFQIAAMGGHVKARHMLGLIEDSRRNWERAMKHWMISASAGFDDSMEAVGVRYPRGLVTKEQYEKTLRAYKESSDEIKSPQRDKAVAHWRSLRSQGRTTSRTG